MFEIVARVVNWVYGWSGDYAVAIGFMAVLVMVILTPLTLKSTKGMLQMQRLQPELRRLQLEHRGDRQKLNEEMMRLYQSNKVNPLSSCLPLVAQMPVFIIMFRILTGLTYKPKDSLTFDPKYLDQSSELYRSLSGKSEMLSLGIDLAARPIDVMRTDFARGLIYAGLVVLLAILYLVQQKMVASRTVSPTMSAGNWAKAPPSFVALSHEHPSDFPSFPGSPP
jgi:YidC/Oxa1 family membrane protein insertase